MVEVIHPINQVTVCFNLSNYNITKLGAVTVLAPKFEVMNPNDGHPFVEFRGSLEDPNEVRIYAGDYWYRPVYYVARKNEIAISDSVNALICRDERSIDRLSLLEFLSFGYVLGRKTVLGGVNILQAGEELLYVKSERKVMIRDRYLFGVNKYEPSIADIKTGLTELWRISQKVFQNLADSIRKKKVIILLSSGLDSRFVACMLKLLDLEAICVNYGVRDSYEKDTSKRIAEKLGYEWHFVEYTREAWRRILNSIEFQDYVASSNFHATSPVVTQFPAVQFIKENICSSRDSVIVTGHPGDFASGGHISNSLLLASSRRDVVDSIIEHHSQLRRNKPHSIIMSLYEYLNNLETRRLTNCQIYEIFDWRERQAKFIANHNRLYEFFGFSWVMPLWNRDFSDFWARLPIRYRYAKYIYKLFLRHYVFRPLGVEFHIRVSSYSLRSARNLAASFSGRIPYDIRERIRRLPRFWNNSPAAQEPHGYYGGHVFLPVMLKYAKEYPSYKCLEGFKKEVGIERYGADPRAFVTDFVAALILSDQKIHPALQDA